MIKFEEDIAVECIDFKSEKGGMLTQPLQKSKKETPVHAVPLMKVE